MHMLAALSTEERFSTLVGLLVGLFTLLGGVGAILWRIGTWIRQQVREIKSNTRALRGDPDDPDDNGLTGEMRLMRTALENLSEEFRVLQQTKRW